MVEFEATQVRRGGGRGACPSSHLSFRPSVELLSVGDSIRACAPQEYLGQAKHVCHLPSQWKSYLDTNLAVDGPDKNTTLADVVSGAALGPDSAAAKPHTFAGTAAVSNLGDDPNWTGHEFSAANTYGYGRLAWDPTLSAEDVTREWVEATWSPADDAAEDMLVKLLLDSWEAYENYTAPLGVGFICAGDHYAPDPPHRVSYTNATATRVGYNRGAYAETYNGAVAQDYASLASTPDELLLCFHNVPYTHQLGAAHGGLSVLEWIYASHKAGAATAASYVTTWKALKGRIDTSVYGDGGYEQVLQRLEFGATEAGRFSDIVVNYFANLTGVVPPAPTPPPSMATTVGTTTGR
jgi:alpha-glucuronidase